MNAHKKFRLWADNHFFYWVDKRVPSQTLHNLHRKNLYTFPTKMGFAYLFLAILIWLLGTNYQNNLILSLSYLLISVFVVAILHTYFNLAGVHLKFTGVEPVFVGETLEFKFLISTTNKNGIDGVQLAWRDCPNVKVFIEPNEAKTFTVPMPTLKRGYATPTRLLVDSRFPLGLIRCWSWLQVPAQGLVYPAPIECAWPSNGGVSEEESEFRVVSDGDEFYGFSQYQPGESLNSVAWKHYARGGNLVSKKYARAFGEENWLDWNNFYAGGDIELALSRMCYWAQKFIQQNANFGLRLPGAEIPPATGENHGSKVLYALATFQVQT